MNQLDAVGVNDTHHRGISQKLPRQMLMAVEQPVQTRPTGQLREQVTPIVVDPTIEGTVPDPFDTEQQS